MSRTRVSCILCLLSGALLLAQPGPEPGPEPEPEPEPGTLSLDACIAYALAHSRELAQRELALQGQQFTTLIQRGKFRPMLRVDAEHEADSERTSGGASLSQELPAGFTLSGSLRGSDNPNGTDAASASVTISKQLLGGGTYRASMLDITNSLLDEMIRQNLVYRYRRELVFRVRRHYYRLIRNHLTRRNNELRVERAKKNLEFALERQDPLDIATARIELPENEAAVLRADRLIETTLDELKELIGMEVRQELVVDTDFQFQTRDLNVDEDIRFCYSNDEDILNALLGLEKLNNELPVSMEQRWPRLTVSASGRREDNGGLNLGGDSDVIVGMALSWELGSVTQRYRVEKLRADIAAKIVSVEDVHQGKVRQISDLARRLQETGRLVDLQEQKLEVAQLRAELYQDRWQNGEIDILEYIRSQNDLENSRIELINQQTAYMELIGEYAFTVGR